MQKYLLTRGLKFFSSRICSFNAPNPNYKIHSLLGSFRFLTSKSHSSVQNPNSHHSENEIHEQNPAEVDDVTSAELKTQIEKFYKGDFEAIPDIFESILKRKLTGKHEDSDDELLNEFRQDQPNELGEEQFDQSSSSDTDSDSDSDPDR